MTVREIHALMKRYAEQQNWELTLNGRLCYMIHARTYHKGEKKPDIKDYMPSTKAAPRRQTWQEQKAMAEQWTAFTKGRRKREQE